MKNSSTGILTTVAPATRIIPFGTPKRGSVVIRTHHRNGGNLIGRSKIAPVISPNKTWEGFIGGVLSAAAVGAAVHWATPFGPWEAGAMALAVCLLGFTGDLIMSAVKRDLGVKDYSGLLPGHGGALDRLDSLAFAAPLFFHLTRYFYTT